MRDTLYLRALTKKEYTELWLRLLYQRFLIKILEHERPVTVHNGPKSLDETIINSWTNDSINNI